MDILAPAKINLSLALHSCRPDGYHLLDSLVGFLDFADQLTIEPSTTSTLNTIGETITNDIEDNLALKALRCLESEGVAEHHIILHKQIYIGAGLGGGSADAAAVLRALGQGLPPATLQCIALKLGADVPICLYGKPARMTGIGEVITAVLDFPIRHLVLIAPEAILSTAQVFAARDHQVFSQQSADPTRPETWHNDLETAACGLCPELIDILEHLRHQDDVIYAGMSGSGVACFAAFPSPSAQDRAFESLQQALPMTRIRPATLLGAQDV